MKKTILVLSLLFIGLFSQAQKQKNIVPSFFMEVPVEQGYLFNGLNFGVGAWFGETTPFTSIGIFVGLLTYQPYSKPAAPITQKATLNLAFDIKTGTRVLIMPTLSVGTNNFYDLNLKLGYAIDKERTIFITGFASQTYNMGIGAVVKMK